MSITRVSRFSALVLATLFASAASAAVSLAIPDVPTRDIPVMIKLTTLSAKLHGSSGSHRGPLFVEAGKDTTVQPPLGNALTFTSTWIELFHPDALPVALATTEFAAVAGYQSVRDIALMPLEALRRRPTMLLTGVQRERGDGWAERITPSHYAASLVEQLDALGATEQRVAQYRGYYERFRAIIAEVVNADSLCADLRDNGQPEAEPGNRSIQDLVSLCAKSDAVARGQAFQTFRQAYFGNLDAQLKQLQLRFRPHSQSGS